MRVRLCSWSLLFSACFAAGVAYGGSLTVTIGTGALAADAGAFAFDFIDGDGAVDNTITLTGFSSDAELEPSVLTGGVTGDVPGAVTFTDSEFFNELLVPVTTFGAATRFTLEYTNVAGDLPDTFSVFVLDPAALNSLLTTDLPGDALFTITLAGDSASAVALASAIDPAVSVTAAPEPSSLAFLVLTGSAIACLVARRSIART